MPGPETAWLRFAGGDGGNWLTGAGGVGRVSNITGASVLYAGGGGGGRGIDDGPGGAGGGGHGEKPESGGGTGTQGEDGKGGGGGGGGVLFAQGSRGGHGITIVRYKVSSGIVATGGTMALHS